MNVVLSEEEFKMLAVEMKAMYPKPDFIPDQYSASIWYRNLNDIPYKVLREAFDLHVQTSQFMPTAYDLRKNAELIMTNTAAAVPSFEEVWAIIKKASSNVNWNAEETFAKMPKIAQDVVGTVEILRSFGMMENEFDTIQKSHSRQRYTGLVAEMVQNAKISPKYSAELTDAAKREKSRMLITENDANKIEDKSASQSAREKFESLEDYKPETDNDFSQDLITRFGTKAPKKED